MAPGPVLPGRACFTWTASVWKETARSARPHKQAKQAALCGTAHLFGIGVATPILLRGPAEPVPQGEHKDLEQDHLRRLEQRAHRQHRYPAAAIVRHGLRRN